MVLLGDRQGDGGLLLDLGVGATSTGGGVAATDQLERDASLVTLEVEWLVSG